jgi:hypothetical protein
MRGDFVSHIHLHNLLNIFQAFKYGCERSEIFRKIQVSYGSIFLSSKIHQGNELPSVQSRGKQSAFISLSAVLTACNYIPLIN